jgi:hypothetical protein
MSGDADPDAELKLEICHKLAISLNERLPGVPGGIETIYKQLLSSLDLELVEDQIDRVLHRRDKDRLFHLAIRLAIGGLRVFGRPIDELAKEAKRRKRIMDAAMIVATETEEFFAGLMEAPRTYDITIGIERGTRRIVRARRLALIRAHLLFWSTVVVVSLAVTFTVLSWMYGLLITLVVGGLTWWSYRSFNLYGRVMEADSRDRHK